MTPARIVRTGLLCTLLFGPSWSQPASADVYATDAFSAGQARPSKIALLPMRAHVSQQKAVVSQEMVAEGQALEDIATRHLAEELEGRGYVVHALSPAEIDADAELAEGVRRFEERYDEESEKIVKEPSKVKKGRYTGGDDAKILAIRLGADGIVTGRMQVMAVTGGRIAVSAVLGAASLGYSYLSVAVVDGKTGSIAAYFNASVQATTTNKVQNESDGLVAKLLKEALEYYPAADQSLVFHQQPGQLIGQVGATARDAESSEFELVPMASDVVAEANKSGQSDGEVISDLEELIGPRDSTDGTQSDGESGGEASPPE